MKIIDVLKERNYFAVAVIAAVFMFFFLPYVQTLGIATDIWYQVIPALNLVLFVIFVAIFGAFISYLTYTFKNRKVCAVNKKGTTGGWIGTAFAFIVGVCPACVGFAGLLLPLGVVTTLVIFGPVFLLASIGLMALSIHLNGGFRK